MLLHANDVQLTDSMTFCCSLPSIHAVLRRVESTLWQDLLSTFDKTFSKARWLLQTADTQYSYKCSMLAHFYTKYLPPAKSNSCDNKSLLNMYTVKASSQQNKYFQRVQNTFQ